MDNISKHLNDLALYVPLEITWGKETRGCCPAHAQHQLSRGLSGYTDIRLTEPPSQALPPPRYSMTFELYAKNIGELGTKHHVTFQVVEEGGAPGSLRYRYLPATSGRCGGAESIQAITNFMGTTRMRQVVSETPWARGFRGVVSPIVSLTLHCPPSRPVSVSSRSGRQPLSRLWRWPFNFHRIVRGTCVCTLMTLSRRSDSRRSEMVPPGARGRVRIDYDKLIGLCRADRPLMSASACGSVPPELRNLWSRLRAQGIRVSTFTRGEQDVPDVLLQMAMYQDLARVRPPGIAVLVTGDGASSYEEYGFIPALEDMYAQGWGVEVLSWNHCLSRNLLRWTQQHGEFIPL